MPPSNYDAESGLHDNRFRYYDPSIGRYISADPIGQFGLLYLNGVSVTRIPPRAPGVDFNLFRYSLGNPISFFDPDGQGPVAVGVCAVAAGLSALKDAYDFSQIVKDFEAAEKEIERLTAELESCGDEKREIEILEEIQGFKAEKFPRLLAAAAEFGATVGAVGFGFVVCPMAISLPTP